MGRYLSGLRVHWKVFDTYAIRIQLFKHATNPVQVVETAQELTHPSARPLPWAQRLSTDGRTDSPMGAKTHRRHTTQKSILTVKSKQERVVHCAEREQTEYSSFQSVSINRSCQ